MKKIKKHYFKIFHSTKINNNDNPSKFNLLGSILYNIILFIIGAITGGLILLLFIFIFVNSSSYVTIPDIKGEDKDTAIKSLKEIGLIPLTKGIGDKVLYTDPNVGERVKKGRHVFIQLGKIDQLTVPDLIGVPLEIAEQFLTSYNLKYKIIKIYFPNEEIETIIDMEPQPNTPINEGDTILLKVSSSEVNK
ncbi:PASTA domain-containing protein [Marinitoga sp. 38H-ov]|uniref:PASTA domain-containing protein n=1 Tax=Marinitoga sp. 38H-ov TaxID=1755814 RepID=UPI0013EC2D6F|nr:PASTA domain-containing protein [Marinitoga sp. 38H-ov]KAF2956438.1 hypothetical protein AS160_05940 [Marinitoga sp. 38H-ov]